MGGGGGGGRTQRSARLPKRSPPGYPHAELHDVEEELKVLEDPGLELLHPEAGQQLSVSQVHTLNAVLRHRCQTVPTRATAAGSCTGPCRGGIVVHVVVRTDRCRGPQSTRQDGVRVGANNPTQPCTAHTHNQYTPTCPHTAPTIDSSPLGVCKKPESMRDVQMEILP
jgi:hypothetical protein